jgi:hypothetical protein
VAAVAVIAGMELVNAVAGRRAAYYCRAVEGGEPVDGAKG